ncbi:unnamed protein product, partial [Dibothriocephalus latus]
MPGVHIHENKLAVRRGDKLSQVAAHTSETDHEPNFAAVKVLTHTGSKTSRELVEAWSTDWNSINRCIDMAPATLSCICRVYTASAEVYTGGYPLLHSLPARPGPAGMRVHNAHRAELTRYTHTYTVTNRSTGISTNMDVQSYQAFLLRQKRWRNQARLRCSS